MDTSTGIRTPHEPWHRPPVRWGGSVLIGLVFVAAGVCVATYQAFALAQSPGEAVPAPVPVREMRRMPARPGGIVGGLKTPAPLPPAAAPTPGIVPTQAVVPPPAGVPLPAITPAAAPPPGDGLPVAAQADPTPLPMPLPSSPTAGKVTEVPETGLPLAPSPYAIPRGLPLPLTARNVITPEAGKFVAPAKPADNVLEVYLGRLQVFNMVRSPRRLQIGDESIANYALLSPTELSIQGLKVGSTVLNVWFADEKEPGKLTMLGFTIRVLPDPDARARLERAYKNLEGEINRAFPNSKVQLGLIGDKLMVTGTAHDTVEANMIMRTVQSNVLPETVDSTDLGRSPALDPVNLVNRVYPAVHRSVINMLRVPGEQQVQLSVQVVEVDRAAARSIGLNFGLFANNRHFIGATTGNLFNTGTGAIGALGNFAGFNAGSLALTGLGGQSNLPIALDRGQIQVALTALRSHGYSKYLAEPNLVAIHGRTANFQVGGLLPVPTVAGGVGIGALQGVSFVPTGVQLAFTPFINDRDKIRLDMSAEISDRDQTNAVTLIDGAAVPSLNTRNFTTTVELREGQTIAVAGLIENRQDADINRIPFWECIPILGKIGSYDRIRRRERELVILVTPRFIHPMECKDVPPPPGGDILEPNDFEFYVLGRIESHLGKDFRSTIRTDCSRRKQFRFMETTCMIGPSGPTVDLPSPAGEAGGLAKKPEAAPVGGNNHMRPVSVSFPAPGNTMPVPVPTPVPTPDARAFPAALPMPPGR